MKPGNYFFTSESVSEGHPDKLCDQISDAILDAYLTGDPNSRVACECLVTTDRLCIAGEITSKTKVDVEKIAREVIENVGYTDPNIGFDFKTCKIETYLHTQSPDIAMGVDTGGAGDQGMMFGYASDETLEYMPIPIILSHRLVRKLAEIRKSGTLPYLRPDSKSQVTVEYKKGVPCRVDDIVISTQHNSEVDLKTITEDMKKHLIPAIVPSELMDSKTKIFVNPTGRFEVGGPNGDTGLTGRKIIVDTYGGVGAHGGGAFSGKDPSKVDRSASYFARYVAKNLVASGIAKHIEIQISYAIGVAEPISIMIDAFGKSSYSNHEIVEVARKVFDFTPQGIIKQLNLKQPIYRQTAAYGHFGRNEEGFTWERLDKVDEIKKNLKNINKTEVSI